MNIFVLILLCLIQGLTEFLPVSSSGHLLLLEQIFGLENNLLLLNLFLHLSTLFAVIIFYRKILLKLLKRPFQPLTFKLILSTIITVFIAIAYKKLNIDGYVFIIYGPCFILTSIILMLTNKFQKSAIVMKQKTVSTKSAIAVGVVQGFAVLPGLSRSGSTIASLIFCGNDEDTSMTYSFLLSIPIIFGGFILECFEVGLKSENLIFANIPLLIFAFLLTFFVALI